jgi:hypothetical protein
MWKYTQHSFAGGVQDVRLIGRQDLERYGISAKTLDNFLVMRQGCIEKRRGTDRACALAFGENEKPQALRLMPYIFEREESYILLIVRTADACKIEVYKSGDSLEPKSTIEDELLTYAAEDIPALSFMQTGDVVVITHRNYPPAKLYRKADGNFAYERIDFKNLGGATLPEKPKIKVTLGENKDQNNTVSKSTVDRTIYYAATAVGEDGRESDLSDPVSATYKTPWLNAFIIKVSIVNNAGTDLTMPAKGVAYYNIYKKTSGEFGFVGTTKGHQVVNKIVGFEQKVENGKPVYEQIGVDDAGNPIYDMTKPVLDPTKPIVETVASVTAFEDDNIIPDTSLTPPKREDFFKKIGDFPTTASIVDQRLVLAATGTKPYTLWWSTVGDLFNFNQHATVRDDDAFSANIPAMSMPRINHIISTRDTLIFTDGAEWVADAISGEALTLKTLSFKQQSQVGASAKLAPTIIENKVVFADATRESVYTIDYNLERDGYKAQSVTILSQSLFDGNPIKAWAYAQHPDSTLWCVLEDGTLAALAYMQEHELCAWSHHVLGGGMKAVDIICTKEVRDGNSAVFILAQHPNGDYTLLRMRDRVSVQTLADGLCLDNLRKESHEGVTPLAEGEIAVDAADGAIRYKTMLAKRDYFVGYPVEAVFRSVTPEAQGESTIQFELKDAISTELRVRNAASFSVVPSVLESVPRQEAYHEVDVRALEGRVALAQKDITLDLAGHANANGAITLKCDAPYPLQVLSMSINYEFDPRTIGVN